jgi:transposase
MSLKAEPPGDIPADTVRVARAAFPKAGRAMQLRDQLGTVYADSRFAALFAVRGRPAAAPWRLALVTVLQVAEGLSDRQAAEAVRGRIDRKYALGLALDDPGFHYSVLCEFRSRLVEGRLEQTLLDDLLVACRAQGLRRRRGRQRTDSTHVLAAVRLLNRLEQVAETMRAALDALAVAAPEWLRAHTPTEWFDRYGRRGEDYRLPQGREARQAFARQVGEDGMHLLSALCAPAPPRRRRACVPCVPCAPARQSRFSGARGCSGISSGRGRSGCVTRRTSRRPPSSLRRPTKMRRATPPSAA